MCAKHPTVLDQNDTTYFNVSGIMVYDPCIAYDYLQASVTVVPFIQENSSTYLVSDISGQHQADFYLVDLFPLDNIASLESLDESCGFADFRDTYLSFPPPQEMPAFSDLPGRKEAQCLALYEEVYEGIQNKNPCFDIYQVAITCPLLWDVLGCKSTRNGRW